jgi:16S rRNA (guanine527-N7)-methyltransferase
VKPLPAPAEAREALTALSPAGPGSIPGLERFAGWLAGPAVERGLIGPSEVERIWSRHIVNCALLAPLLPADASVCDLGSGAGLPGVVLGILRPDATVVLLEPLLRRSQFLQEVLDDLGLDGVAVVRARAEQYARSSPGHDAVVARAVAPLPRLLELAVPLLRPGGAVLALKGRRAAAELGDAAGELDRDGVVDREVLTLREGGNVTHAIRVVRPPALPDHRATEDR